MKKLFAIAIFVFSVFLTHAQTTYYWVGGLNAAYTASASWNTSLNGSGSSRATALSTDILIFDGTNVGGVTPTTGRVVATITGSANVCAQLKCINGSRINIGRSTAGSATLIINGDATSADDFIVGATDTLTLGGSSQTTALFNYDVNIQLAASATNSGLVSGTLYLSPLISNVHTRSYITASSGTSLVFATGSSCYINDSTTTSGFNASVINTITFKSGASLYYYTGRSPIGNNSTTQFTNFESGANIYYRGSNVQYTDGLAYGSSSWCGNKNYANLFIQNGATFTSDGTFYKIEGLTIDNGCLFVTHSSGATPLLGNLVVNGTYAYPVAGSSNNLVMGGNTPQTISGTGTLTVPNFIVANYSNVTMQRNLKADTSVQIFGKINFDAGFQITGPSTFTSKVAATATSVTGNTIIGTYQITGIPASTLSGNLGLIVTGPGIAPNTNVIHTTSGAGVLTLSKPTIATSLSGAYIFSSDTATLITANVNGLDSLLGSVIVTGNKSFQSGTNYIINGATSKPFGISSGSVLTTITAGTVDINAAVTVNRSVLIYRRLGINGKMSLRPQDSVHVLTGGTLNGSFNSTNYIATNYNSTSGLQSILQYDGVSSTVTLPIGTVDYYLPITLAPTSSSDFAVTVYEGITSNGQVNGTALTAAQKQLVVNAVWNVNRIVGTGNCNLQLGWNALLEGSTFTTLPNAGIGLINNTGSSWALPIGTGNNTTNIVNATVSSFGAYGAGAVPSSQPFVFNPLSIRTYGSADFNGGATSLNTSQPIVYSSTNTAVATIVGGNIHIVGSGTTDIIASQASDGFYASASVTQTLTVNKAPLTIAADNKTKFETQLNPTLTANYTGFVLGETSAVLLTPAVLTTTATTLSIPGFYPITVTGATAANYTISIVNGTLTVLARQAQTITFNALAAKTYGNADFLLTATSTNNTIPITYVSSNPAVATIIGTNTVKIVGAGIVNITASQAGNIGYIAAADVIQVLTINKKALIVKALDTVKVQGMDNPVFSLSYVGYVLGDTTTNLTTAAMVSTTAIKNSAAGYYTLVPGGAASSNYSFTYINGRMTIYPPNGNGQAYLNAFMINNTTLTVRVYSPKIELGDILIYDAAGRFIQKSNLFLPIGFNSTNIDISNWPSGIYYIKLKGVGFDLTRPTAIIK
ncbi:MAG: MBG domain-containing protein [Chitinophagaceae bacterium]